MKRTIAISLALCLFAVSQTSAYTIKRTESGDSLRWKSAHLTYHIHQNLPKYLNENDVIAALQRAFSSWSNVQTADVNFTYGGRTDQLPGFDTANIQQNQNVVHFETENWEHGEDVLAVTTTIYRKSTFEIVDSDISFNAVNFDWSTSQALVKTDLQNCATHEIGHLLGLDHSEHSEASMFGTHIRHELNKRWLDNDDRVGIAFLYPNPNPPEPTQLKNDAPTQMQLMKSVTRKDDPLPEPEEEIEPEGSSAGCSLVGHRPSSGSGIVLILLAGLLFLRRRRSLQSL